MAMFPNATRGYMPFVQGSKTHSNKRSKIHVNGGKLHKSENRKNIGSLSNSSKMYQITLKDKQGVTYKCIVKADGSQSLPELCEQKLNVNVVATHRSLPDITGLKSPEKQRQILCDKLEAVNKFSKSEESFSTSLDLRNCGKKESVFSSFFRFLKEKTGKTEKDKSKNTSSSKNSSKSMKSNVGKSKRKPRDLAQRKRQRTVSAMSNLDPIEESPNEHEFEDLDSDDNDSYTHYSSGCPSDSDSLASQISCNIEQISNSS